MSESAQAHFAQGFMEVSSLALKAAGRDALILLADQFCVHSHSGLGLRLLRM
ncbi:hypothetical protein LG047_14315 [Methylocystis sp. WRRC1]|uniref:hypothetical protein n=1 Tax=Methylocystis sp. WRRC1 TaxID=1732014 RepID=UPI001D142602|nr:hypothetical protein [Methylocystis sp. WRRC1]MCC3246477.1 hypothetical protein [Methylocystis sp. WRRC1]